MAAENWRSSWTKRIQVSVIAGLAYPLINLLGHTLRWRVEGLEHLDAIAAASNRLRRESVTCLRTAGLRRPLAGPSR